MSKVTLKVEIEEKDYKALIGEEVFNIWKGNTIFSTIFNAIKTATPITECDDAVSRQSILDQIHKAQDSLKSDNDIVWERNKGNFKGLAWANRIILDTPSVLPKREQGEWIIKMDCEGKTRTCICPKCGEKTGKYTWENPNYCSNCGAEMR